ncbi:hypothetical protein K9N50_05455 [bacterium]|nr:hypothetical protein [bacterium]
MINDTKNNSGDCEVIRSMIERSDTLSESERHAFDLHINSCRACAAEVEFENTLREVIAPQKLASPSRGFEASLMAELGMKPVFEPVPAAKPFAIWGRAAGIILGIAAIFYLYWDTVQSIGLKGLRTVMLGSADVVMKIDSILSGSSSGVIAKLDGYVFTCIGEAARVGVNQSLLIMNLMFLSMAALSGIIAVTVSNRS